MSPRDRRAVLLGAVLLAPALFYIWGIKPYIAALDDTRQQLAIERDALSRERAAIAAARKNPELQHLADSAMRAMTPRLFEGRDDVMASAELASFLGEMARTRHVWLQDAATRPAVLSPSGVRTLRVEIRAESDLQGVLSLLQALETGPKLVRVERLDLSRQPNRSEEGGAETLALSATISGFAIPAEPIAAPAPAVAKRDSVVTRGAP
jgi:type II secretion system (T2SS) protein M